LEFINLESRILFAKNNNVEKNKLIDEYTPFIKSAIKTISEDNNQDYLTIGMLAFSDAIDKYNVKKGKFLIYSKIVIKNRIIDEVRRKSKLKETELKDNSVKEYDDILLLQIEINEFKQMLNEFDISFEYLLDSNPKHKKTREKCKYIAKVIKENDELYNYFIRTKMLPIKKTLKIVKVSDKVFDRFRKYIIALILIQDKKFGYLKDYIY